MVWYSDIHSLPFREQRVQEARSDVESALRLNYNHSAARVLLGQVEDMENKMEDYYEKKPVGSLLGFHLGDEEEESQGKPHA